LCKVKAETEIGLRGREAPKIVSYPEFAGSGFSDAAYLLLLPKDARTTVTVRKRAKAHDGFKREAAVIGEAQATGVTPGLRGS
jgi:hypothetical protein